MKKLTQSLSLKLFVLMLAASCIGTHSLGLQEGDGGSGDEVEKGQAEDTSPIILGEIFEIKTKQGNAYLHYIYKDKDLGELVRVLPGFYTDRPASFEEVASSQERYMIFFPLAATSKLKLVAQVGHHPTTGFGKPKYMRSPHTVRGEFLGWHIVDTDTWHRKLVKTLTPAQKRLSDWAIWNGALLIERLEQGWVLANWQPFD